MNKRFLGVVLGAIAGYGCGIVFYAVVALLWEALAGKPGLFFGLDPYWNRLSALKDILGALILVWVALGAFVGYRVGAGYDYASASSGVNLKTVAIWVGAAIGIMFIIAVALNLVSRTSPSSDGSTSGAVALLEAQRSVNVAGVPVARRMLALGECTGTCKRELIELRETLVPYEEVLTGAIETMEAVQLPKEYRQTVFVYREVLEVRLEAIRLYIEAIEPSGSISSYPTLERGDTKWNEAQSQMGRVVDEMQKVLDP